MGGFVNIAPLLVAFFLAPQPAAANGVAVCADLNVISCSSSLYSPDGGCCCCRLVRHGSHCANNYLTYTANDYDGPS